MAEESCILVHAQRPFFCRIGYNFFPVFVAEAGWNKLHRSTKTNTTQVACILPVKLQFEVDGSRNQLGSRHSL
jgi:hypothetical protein